MELLRIERRGKTEDASCVYCRGSLGDVALVTCDGCGVTLHVDCRRELAGCATMGCVKQRRRRVAPPPPPPAPARSTTPLTASWPLVRRPRPEPTGSSELAKDAVELLGLFLQLFLGPAACLGLILAGTYPDVIAQWLQQHLNADGRFVGAILLGAVLMIAGLAVSLSKRAGKRAGASWPAW